MIYLPCIVSLYHHRRPHIEQFNIGQAHLTIQLSIDKDEPQRQLQLSVYHKEDTKHKTPNHEISKKPIYEVRPFHWCRPAGFYVLFGYYSK